MSKQKAGQHRDAILSAASRLFRARGIDKVGVAEVTEAAGLTHGGFYGHFASKEALAAEVCDLSFGNAVERVRGAASLEDYIDQYVSADHRDREGPCPMVALGADVSRLSGPVRDQFTAGVARYIAAIRAHLPPDDPLAEGRAAALVSVLVGGMNLARAVAVADPALSDQILAGVRQQARAAIGR
ncbi:TetR/AcrR family transcriptional regulator [Niveispirillum lacus]|uniref:TetR/AcrR family transcriptional regulator n=1 Tax=Niveispirillum lacus TaxID=1981099 RepID=UPI001FE870E2|nr:TetR/AcrR family transcriptional regulator [Niveispirillum lacus]